MSSLYARDLTTCLQFLEGLPILGVLGARRTGKTTLLRGWYSTLEGAKSWLDGDNPAHLLLWDSLRGGQDPTSWLHSLLGVDPLQLGAHLVLDEAQVLPEVSRLVKVLSDAHPRLRVVMSGSSALKLRDFTAESMAGRKQLLELYPLTLREYLSGVPAVQRPHSAVGLLKEMLVWGGYPGVLNLPLGWPRSAYLTEVLDATLYRDLLSETRGRDVSSFKKLLVYLARSVGGKLNVSNLAGTLEQSRVTTRRFLELLSEASVITLLPGIDARGIVPKAQPKVYFMDNGLLSMLLSDDRPLELRRPEDQGALLENWIVAELIKTAHDHARRVNQLGYLWDKRGETLLVRLEGGELVWAGEVKLSATQAGSRATRDAPGGVALETLTLLSSARKFME